MQGKVMIIRTKQWYYVGLRNDFGGCFAVLVSSM